MHAQAYGWPHGDIKPRSGCGHAALEPSSVGHPDRALRSAVPRRARRFDGRGRPARHSHRSRAVHVLAAVGGQRLRARLRRPAAARRPGRRPARAPARVPRRAGRVRGRIAVRRARQQPRAADRGPVHQGHRGRLHRPGRAVTAHHHLPRGPDAQPGHQHLLRVRGQRILTRPGPVGPAHRGQLAADAAGAGPGRAAHPDRRDPVRPAGRAGHPQRPQVRHPRRGHRHRRDAAAGLHRRRRPAGRGGSARTIGSFAAVVVALAGFVAIERRSADPLVPLGIFRSGALTRANIGAMTLFGSYVSFQFLVTQYLQSLAGWSALSTALAFLPAGVVVAILSTRMTAIIGRFGPARVTVGAFIALVAGYVVFLRVGVSPDYPSVILPAVMLIGVAFGLGFSALSLAATAGIPDDEQGLAASLFQTSFQVGGAIVLAIVTAVVEAGGASQITTAQATLGAYRPALAVITGISAVGALTALSGLLPSRRRAPVADIVLAQVPAPASERVPVPAAQSAHSARDAEADSGDGGDRVQA